MITAFLLCELDMPMLGTTIHFYLCPTTTTTLPLQSMTDVTSSRQTVLLTSLVLSPCTRTQRCTTLEGSCWIFPTATTGRHRRLALIKAASGILRPTQSTFPLIHLSQAAVPFLPILTLMALTSTLPRRYPDAAPQIKGPRKNRVSTVMSPQLLFGAGIPRRNARSATHAACTFSSATGYAPRN